MEEGRARKMIKGKKGEKEEMKKGKMRARNT